jgi:acetylornithine deacetylase/succinyl-diaminopimelate desuccinylase-like protein
MPDWTQARGEAVKMLSGLVQIDTSNPPGNETKAAEYLKAILDKEGIPSEIVALEPGRGNLIARLRGNGKGRPILLLGHTDVVAVERDKWTVDPFGGIVKDGYVYGRGATDNKGGVAANVEVFLLLHRLKVPLQRDVILLAQGGEENSAPTGIRFLVAQHWDKIACEYALDEGGTTRLNGGKVQFVGVETAEKTPWRVRLVARGTAGHSSVPRADNAIVHLAAAVAKVGALRMPVRLNETSRAFLAGLAKIGPPEDAALVAGLLDPGATPAAEEKLRAKNPSLDALVRTTISPTIIRGGIRENVIPTEAEAVLNVRAVPGEDLPAFLAALGKLIDDPAVEVIGPPAAAATTPPSSTNSPMFQALERAQAAMFPHAVTLPRMLSGATDMAPLRAKGVQAYGLGAVETVEDTDRVHGHDERISIEGLGKLVELIYRAVTDVAARPE